MKARLDLYSDVARVTLAAPKANILDRVMVSELDAIFATLESHRDLKAIIVTSDGPHFSFGASVEEHLPGEIEGALARLGSLLRRVASAPAPTIAAVRGQCLGGGFELVLACDLIVAEESAMFGAPEINLGVFPPAASALLPVRIGVAAAAEMILTGESWNATKARDRGLVARIGEVGLLFEEHFLPQSPNALRHAARAVRRNIVRALRDDLPQLDRLYLDELMAQPGAADGIRAFLDKRARVNA
jgi:cyclohexa-1,5-dienecarbonyl-CoA hydratase